MKVSYSPFLQVWLKEIYSFLTHWKLWNQRYIDLPSYFSSSFTGDSGVDWSFTKLRFSSYTDKSLYSFWTVTLTPNPVNNVNKYQTLEVNPELHVLTLLSSSFFIVTVTVKCASRSESPLMSYRCKSSFPNHLFWQGFRSNVSFSLDWTTGLQRQCSPLSGLVIFTVYVV